MWVSGGHQGSGVKGCYSSLSSGDLTNTSSHMYVSWYLPIFLFRDGSLTLISIASLMALLMLSFTPDEAKVEDSAKACDLTINLFC